MTKRSIYRICNGDEDESCSNNYIADCFDSLSDLEECISFHKNYFSIPVGTYCDGDKRKLSVAEASFWSKFRADKCIRIPFNNSDVNSNMTSSGGSLITIQISLLIIIVSMLF